MPHKNFEKPVISVSLLLSILLIVFATSSNLVSASGGAIAITNIYPQEGETYQVVNHFTYQLTAVNTNTTVSVSIDNGPPRPMVLQGISTEVINGDSSSGDWYTWQLTVPAITDTGRHTFQFFSHYYVWQDTDHYWSEFNSYSSVHSFTIAGPTSTSTTLTPTPPSVPPAQPIAEFQYWIVLSSMLAIIIASIVFAKKKSPKKETFSQINHKTPT